MTKTSSGGNKFDVVNPFRLNGLNDYEKRNPHFMGFYLSEGRDYEDRVYDRIAP